MWMFAWLAGCERGDGCPKTDMAMVACPDGRCVFSLDNCEPGCSDGLELCESTGQCFDPSSEECPSDTGAVQ
jgi:hypothetical protein